MSLMVSDNSLYLKNPKNGEFLPVSIFNSGADKSMEKIAEFAENVKSEASTAMEARKTELVESMQGDADGIKAQIVAGAEADIETKKNQVLEQIPADYTGLNNSINQVKSDLAESMTLVESKNLIDPSKTVSGYLTSNGNIQSGSYWTTDFIKVKEGDVIKSKSVMRFVLGYTESKTVTGTWIGQNVTPLTGIVIPNDVSYIRVSITSNVKAEDSIIVKNEETVVFKRFHNPYYAGTDKFYSADIKQQITEEAKSKIYDDLMDKNVLNPSAIIDGKYQFNENVSVNESYALSDYLPVEPGETYYFFFKNLNRCTNIRAIACFDANKNFISAIKTDNQNSFTSDENTKYIRVTFRVDSKPSMMWKSKNPKRFVPYEDGIINQKYVDIQIKPVLHCYLPPEIYIAVGRTIELYNSLVCLESDKYHLDWVCPVGKVYKNKWSCTGTSSGSYTLTLNIYDDSNILIDSYSSSVKVAGNIAAGKKILPIGDSLSNNKEWLTEVPSLSDGKIVYVGTRSLGSRYSEGRSGVTADWYNSNSTYTFDTNYVGNPSVPGSSNPFWDGTKFSLSHYITTQNGYVDTPDAVQILLGTNGIYNINNVVANIKTMVDSIVSEYPSMPIFVCNTIYRANQLLDSVGDDGYVSSHEYLFSADLKIMNLQIALSDALAKYTNVYIVPLSICMDRDNNFGRIEVPVNPRLTDVKTYIPIDSVHPQYAGYMQMADVMYSAYCAVLV